jgi:purine-binding chemotaxis protein CheW
VIQYCTFYLGKDLLGVDILTVQEITRGQEITPVPHAEPFVKGLINLRGQIVMAVSLRSVFGLPSLEREPLSRMADRAGDVAEFPEESLVPPPAPLAGPGARLVKGVHRMDDRMLHVVEPAGIFARPDGATTRNPGAFERQEAS